MRESSRLRRSLLSEWEYLTDSLRQSMPPLNFDTIENYGSVIVEEYIRAMTAKDSTHTHNMRHLLEQ